MKTEKFYIGNMPAALYGAPADGVYLFVHGQHGCKEEAERFAAVASGRDWQVLGVDLPEHGERRQGGERLYPWVVVPELREVWRYLGSRWQHTALRANSIGAWFSLLALADTPPQRSLFVSPIVDMELLIGQLMQQAGVSEQRLEQERTIITDWGQELSWRYLCYAREHQLKAWRSDTALLFGSEDELTPSARQTELAARYGCRLSVLEGGEHWFHTEEQLAFLADWERREL